MATVARLPVRHGPTPSLSRREIEDMIEALIVLLDAADPDPDVEDEMTEDDDPPGEDTAI